MSRARISAIVTVSFISIIIVAVIFGVVIPWAQPAARENEERQLRLQRDEIQGLISKAGTKFLEEFALEEREGEEGDLYYVGILSDNLNGWLADLVGVYNADPSTTEPITVEEVRYSLTEGISYTANEPDLHAAFVAFIQWCGRDIELVENGEKLVMKDFTSFTYAISKEFFNEHGIFASYEEGQTSSIVHNWCMGKIDHYDPNRNPIVAKGEEVSDTGIENCQYATHKEGFPNYKFPWEQAMKTTATAEGVEGSAFFDFRSWSKASADLMYREDFFDGDGNLRIAAGDKVVTETLTNYNFIMEKEGTYSNMKFSWAQAMKTGKTAAGIATAVAAVIVIISGAVSFL